MVKPEVHIIELPNERVSLELGDMSAADFRNIVLNIFGEEAHLSPDIVHEINITGQVFTVAREFGEMYVVSRTAEGDEILRRIFRSLGDT